LPAEEEWDGHQRGDRTDLHLASDVLSRSRLAVHCTVLPYTTLFRSGVCFRNKPWTSSGTFDHHTAGQPDSDGRADGHVHGGGDGHHTDEPQVQEGWDGHQRGDRNDLHHASDDLSR